MMICLFMLFTITQSHLQTPPPKICWMTIWHLTIKLWLKMYCRLYWRLPYSWNPRNRLNKHTIIRLYYRNLLCSTHKKFHHLCLRRKPLSSFNIPNINLKLLYGNIFSQRIGPIIIRINQHLLSIIIFILNLRSLNTTIKYPKRYHNP